MKTPGWLFRASTLYEDGSWVDLNPNTGSSYGAHNQPFDGIVDALNYITAGSKLLLKPGSTHWSGTLASKMRLDPPPGLATIGE